MNAKIIQKSIKIARQLHPASPRPGVRGFYHFAFLWNKNKLIAVGRNSEMPVAKALYFGKKFDLPNAKEYKYIHAEIDAFSKAWGKFYIDHKFSLVSLRLNNKLELRNAKPCSECSTVISALNLTDVAYSNEMGEITW